MVLELKTEKPEGGPECPMCGAGWWMCIKCGATCPPFTPDATGPDRIPPIFKGATIFILGDGPSLTAEDVLRTKGHGVTIAINYSIQLAPWADVLYYYHDSTLAEFLGPLNLHELIESGLQVVHTNPAVAHTRPWNYIPFSGVEGLELDPKRGLRHGTNSGHAAINLAVRLGAAKIILLGYDCGELEGRFHWLKPSDSPSRAAYDYGIWRANYRTIPPALPAGVQVLNASRHTTIDAFPVVTLEEGLRGKV